MLSRLRAPRLSKAVHRPYALGTSSFSQRCPLFRHEFPATQHVDYESKYADKLHKRAQEQGTSLSELRERLKALERDKKAQKREAESSQGLKSEEGPAGQKVAPITSVSPTTTSRKDSSPVRPLGSIFNLDKLLETPHDADKISALWQAYHSSRSGGTGRGYLCATIPIGTYEKMANVATRYPRFVLPLPRDASQTEEPDKTRAHEFYYMEWAFHGAPEELSVTKDLFQRPRPSSNPQISTILFTPLQEYKLRTAFATPYLVLTNYTDLAQSHGVVLMRGEITPSAANTAGASSGENTDGRYLLSQQDAQLLAMGLQRFYLWSEGQGETVELLKQFHDNPSDFNWEELLKHSDY